MVFSRQGALHQEVATFSGFGAASCVAAVVAVLHLSNGLTACLGDRTLFDDFFISEPGTGRNAERFTSTLLTFGVLMIPFFLNFMLGYHHEIPAEALKFAAGGCLAVCGIIGIGLWDLRSPLHYLSIMVWLLWLLKLIAAESLCVGERINGHAE